MFCQSCGAQLNGAAYCGSCGTAAGGRGVQTPDGPVEAKAIAEVGNGLSIAGIVCGGIAFLILPIILGPVGLILGAVAKSRGERLALVAMIVGGVGFVGGMVLGAVVGSL